MTSAASNPICKKENIRFLRRHLGLSQKEFINRFLTDENGKPLMCVATLSELESKGGSRISQVVLSAAEKLSVDPMIFSMDPEEFVQQIDILLPASEDAEGIQQSLQKRGNVSQLLERLTMYFADQIYEKKLKRGDQVESDRELAAKLNVGRSALREAMKVLDVLGMIEIYPGQGTFISSSESNFFIIPLAWSLFLSNSQVEEILAVRNLLEVKAAELAASCSNIESMSRLHEISHRIFQAYGQRDYKKFLEEDLAFHICIAECSQNQVIYSMIQTISNLMKRVSGTGMVDEKQLRAIHDEHQMIYGLILAHDPQGAASAMQRHLSNSMQRYNYR